MTLPQISHRNSYKVVMPLSSGLRIGSRGRGRQFEKLPRFGSNLGQLPQPAHFIFSNTSTFSIGSTTIGFGEC